MSDLELQKRVGRGGADGAEVPRKQEPHPPDMKPGDPGLESIRNAIPVSRNCPRPVMALTRQHIEATMLVLHRLQTIPTPDLMRLYKKCQTGLDLEVGTCAEEWDLEYPAVRMRAHVLERMIEWVLDPRRMVYGPYQAGYGPDPRDVGTVSRGVADGGR